MEVVITNIETRTSKRGNTCKVAVFNTIQIGGYFISRCIAYNGVSIGDTVRIWMIGGIIPRLTKHI